MARPDPHEYADLWRGFLRHMGAASPRPILCRQDGSPLTTWRGHKISWKHDPLVATDAIWHAEQGGLIALRPADLQCAVVDIDRGGEQARMHVESVLGPALSVMKSKSGTGRHLWYAQEGRFNVRYYDEDWGAGELRHENCYVVVMRPDLLMMGWSTDIQKVDVRRLLTAPGPRWMDKTRGARSKGAAPEKVGRGARKEHVKAAAKTSREPEPVEWQLEGGALFRDSTYWARHIDAAVASDIVAANLKCDPPLTTAEMKLAAEEVLKRELREEGVRVLEAAASIGEVGCNTGTNIPSPTELGIASGAARRRGNIVRDQRIKELRDDQKLSWREIGEVLDIHASTAMRAYRSAA